jgi:hypothetical protein
MSMSNPDFDARLARIASGAGSSKATLYVGLDEIYHVSYTNRGKPVGASAANSGALYPLVAVIALAIGVMSYGVAAWMRFRLVGASTGSGNPMTEMGIRIGAALFVALVIGTALGFRSRQMRAVMAAGAVAATALFHNLVHMYPGHFAQVFSPDWVEVVTGSTRAQSVNWMGQSYTF